MNNYEKIALTFAMVSIVSTLSFGTIGNETKRISDSVTSATTASVLRAFSTTENPVELNEESVDLPDVHTNQYWGFSFEYDADKYPAIYKWQYDEPIAKQSFIDEELAKARELSRMPMNQLSSDEEEMALAMADSRYEQYLQNRQLARSDGRQVFTSGLNANNVNASDSVEVAQSPTKTIGYQVVPKFQFSADESSDFVQIDRGSTGSNVVLNTSNSYYNRFGERISPQRDFDNQTYDWWFDQSLRAVLFNVCDQSSCVVPTDEVGVIEMFPQIRNDNGYYVYYNPVKDAPDVNSLNACVSLPQNFICFSGNDSQSIATAINSVALVE